VAQAPDAVNRFAHTLKPGGILIIDSDLIAAPPAGIAKAYGVGATTLARNRIQDMIVTNMIMLGALCRVTGVVGRAALEAAIADAVPKGKTEMNRQAFELGFDTVSQF